MVAPLGREDAPATWLRAAPARRYTVHSSIDDRRAAALGGPHLADGGAPAHAAGGGGAGPRRDRAGGDRRQFKPLTFLAALVGALFIQVGTNLTNDYSDARRGADTEDRLGPVRVTAGGLVPPRQVLIATYVAFGVAVLAGAYLIATAGWELLLVGAASILAGVLYTGGPRPYWLRGARRGVRVPLLRGRRRDGLVLQPDGELDWEAFVLAVPVGLLASAILVVNNVRDLETDRRAGKRTLAVRLGRERTRVLFVAMLVLAFLSAPLPWVLG